MAKVLEYLKSLLRKHGQGFLVEKVPEFLENVLVVETSVIVPEMRFQGFLNRFLWWKHT